MTDVIIGTSGWQYRDWHRLFYPPGVTGTKLLPYFATHFKTVEINSTFYGLPKTEWVQRWAASVPDDFVFSVKLNRFLTHNKRLVPDDETAVRLYEFLELLQPLGAKFAVLLVQLPPSMQAADERLTFLAKELAHARRKLKLHFGVAVEFRHASWFNQQTFALMRTLNFANVISDSPQRWPASKEITADFAYIRFHGSKRLYRSSYTDQELADWLTFIRTQAATCNKVYCYFDNDHDAVAVQNAKTMLGML